MARIIADRVFETSTSTGTGAFALAAALTGFRRFNAVCSVGDTAEYTIFGVDGSGNPTGEWETGLGTYSAANTLTRTTVQASSNGGSVVNFSAGTKYVQLSHNSASLSGANSGLVKLSTVVCNPGDTSVIFTGLDSSKYSMFKLYSDYYWPNTDWTSLNGYVSTDNGSTWITTGGIYDFSFNITGNSGAGNTVQTITAGNFLRILPGQNSANTNGGSGEWDFINFGSSSVIKTYRGRAVWNAPDGSRYQEVSTGRILTTSVINALKLEVDSGTISGGKFRLYGLV